VSLPRDLAVRAVSEEDGPTVVALIATCEATFADWLPAGWAPPMVAPDWPDRFLEADRWSRAAFDPAGAAIAFVSFDPAERAGFAHVGAVFVHPSRWRQGIAAELLESAEAEMHARDFTAAQLWTPDGAPAERFYRAQGWLRTERRLWHEWLGLTVVGYEKTLA
jgi:GNAT superfamily N-acetyltransferase